MPIIEEVVNNVALALVHARSLAAMRADSPRPAIDAILSAAFETPIQGDFRTVGTNGLNYYFGGTAGRKVVYIDGIRNNDQAASIVTAYSTPAGGATGGGESSYFVAQASSILNVLFASHDPTPEYIDIAGHSAGGATALSVQSQLRIGFPNIKTKVFTFGSPRTGGAPLRDATVNAAIVRYMTPGDPIPLMPLSLDDAPIIATLLTAPIIFLWSQYCHTHGGIQIAGDGTTTPAQLPTDAVASPTASLVNWMFGVENDPTNQHAISAYVNYLSVSSAARPTPAQQDLGFGGGEDFDIPPKRQINVQRARVEQAIFRQAEFQTSNPIITPDPDLFKAVRSGRIWFVKLGEAYVITAGPEKRARHIARAGNDFLRSLQKQAVVDPDSILSQLEIFMQLAQDPTSGFVPTINVTPPT
jgi:hypothetical protein